MTLSETQNVVDRTNLPCVQDIIAKRRNSLFGHVVRLDDHTPAHSALSQVAAARTGSRFGPSWRRRPGRPRHSWIQQLGDGTPFSIRAGSSSWPFWVDATDLCCLRDDSDLMMIMTGNRFSAISERHVVQLTLNLEGVRHLELLKFDRPILVMQPVLHLTLFAVSKFRMLHSEDLGIFKVLEDRGHVQASDCRMPLRLILLRVCKDVFMRNNEPHSGKKSSIICAADTTPHTDKQRAQLYGLRQSAVHKINNNETHTSKRTSL